jgi:hypothetical protein
LVNAGGEDRLDVRVNERDKKKKTCGERQKHFNACCGYKNKRKYLNVEREREKKKNYLE